MIIGLGSGSVGLTENVDHRWDCDTVLRPVLELYAVAVSGFSCEKT
jgi:hypothetical protein